MRTGLTTAAKTISLAIYNKIVSDGDRPLDRASKIPAIAPGPIGVRKSKKTARGPLAGPKLVKSGRATV
jgi:hypothetical protein